MKSTAESWRLKRPSSKIRVNVRIAGRCWSGRRWSATFLVTCTEAVSHVSSLSPQSSKARHVPALYMFASIGAARPSVPGGQVAICGCSDLSGPPGKPNARRGTTLHRAGGGQSRMSKTMRIRHDRVAWVTQRAPARGMSARGGCTRPTADFAGTGSGPACVLGRSRKCDSTSNPETPCPVETGRSSRSFRPSGRRRDLSGRAGLSV